MFPGDDFDRRDGLCIDTLDVASEDIDALELLLGRGPDGDAARARDHHGPGDLLEAKHSYSHEWRLADLRMKQRQGVALALS